MMKRRDFIGNALKTMLYLPLLGAWGCGRAKETVVESFAALASAQGAPGPLTRIGFGSCLIHSFPQPVWKAVMAKKPELFLMLGDNVYADSEQSDQIQHAYDALANNVDFIPFRASGVELQAVWDDHDYGINDMGAEHSNKESSKDIMLNFFGEPANSPRRKRVGNYGVQYYGDESGRRVQVLLLDLRWFRTPLAEGEFGQYIPHPDPNATMLGAEQWDWLENELRQPADVRIVCSSIQFVSQIHFWEKWSNYPVDRNRFLRLIDELDLRNIVFISGDMHFGELSSETTPGGRVIYDVTASGLNRFTENKFVENDKRVTAYDKSACFGWLDLDWDRKVIVASVNSEAGELCFKQEIPWV